MRRLEMAWGRYQWRICPLKEPLEYTSRLHALKVLIVAKTTLTSALGDALGQRHSLSMFMKAYRTYHNNGDEVLLWKWVERW